MSYLQVIRRTNKYIGVNGIAIGKLSYQAGNLTDMLQEIDLGNIAPAQTDFYLVVGLDTASYLWVKET